MNFFCNGCNMFHGQEAFDQMTLPVDSKKLTENDKKELNTGAASIIELTCQACQTEMHIPERKLTSDF